MGSIPQVVFKTGVPILLFFFCASITAVGAQDLSDVCRQDLIGEFEGEQPGQMCGENTRGTVTPFEMLCATDGPGQTSPNSPYRCGLCEPPNRIRFYVQGNTPCTEDELASVAQQLNQLLVDSGECITERTEGTVNQVCQDLGLQIVNPSPTPSAAASPSAPAPSPSESTVPSPSAPAPSPSESTVPSPSAPAPSPSKSAAPSPSPEKKKKKKVRRPRKCGRRRRRCRRRNSRFRCCKKFCNCWGKHHYQRRNCKWRCERYLDC